MSVTKGVIHQIVELNERPIKVIVQVLNILGTKENKTAPNMRCRLLVTDGESSFCMVLTQTISALVENGSVKKFSIISITSYHPQMSKDILSITIKDLKVLQLKSGPIAGVLLDSNNSVTFANNKRKAEQKNKDDLISSQDNTSSRTVSRTSVGQTFTTRSPSPVLSPPDEDVMPEMDEVPKHSKPLPVFKPAGKALWNQNDKNGSGTSVDNNKPKYEKVPIIALTTFSKNWCVEARVTSLTDIREWSNERGSGKVFTINMLDNSSEISATFYNEACNKFHPFLKLGQVYSFAVGLVRNVDKKSFARLTNPFELVFHAESFIRVVSDDRTIKKQMLRVVKIRNIADYPVDSIVDIAGVVRGYGEVTMLNAAKDNTKQYLRRELTVVDDTNFEVRVTLWGEHANLKCEWGSMPIIVVKGARVQDYQGRVISSCASSFIQVNPSIPETECLMEVQDSLRTGTFQVEASLTIAGGGKLGDLNDSHILNRKDVSALKSGEFIPENLPDKGLFVTLKAVITHIKRTGEMSYPSCPTAGCCRKVIQRESTGAWMCGKCNKEFPKCHRRFILYMSLSDQTGGQIVTVHNDMAEQLLGISAQQMNEMKETNLDGFNNIISDALFQTYICRLKIHKENVMNEDRVKFTLVGANAVNLEAECEQMAAAVRLMKDAAL